MSDSSSDPGCAGAPAIERVELAAGGVAGLLVRVLGDWPGAKPTSTAGTVLLVRGDRRQFRFPALPGPPAEDGRWRATFSVPAELRPALERELVLEVGSLAVRLPGPTEPDAQPDGGGILIDRGVLAERRARRAEAGEERQARRAAEAESLVAEMSVKVARLEAELDELRRIPGEAAAEIATEAASLRRELRVARQRAHAEEQVRLEEVGAARAAESTARAAEAAARAAEMAASERIAELEARVAALSRAAASAEAGRPAAAPFAAPLQLRLLAQEAILAAASPLFAAAISVAGRPRAGAPPSTPRRALALEQALAIGRSRVGSPNDGNEGAGLGRDGSLRAAPSAGASQPRLEASPAAAAGSASAEALAPSKAHPLEASRAAAAGPASADAPAPDPDRLDAARQRLRASVALPAPTGPPDASRMPGALRRLSGRDPAAGGRILASLVPAQDRVTSGAYELILADVRRVVAGDGGAVRVETDAAGLARLILASAPRRLLARRGARVEGQRRALKPLRRLARAPLPWAELAVADVVLDPGLAYRWIALAAKPEWTRGERFTVAHCSLDRPEKRWFIRADDGRPLAVTTECPRDQPAAEVICADANLAAFLAGTADSAARVTGDAAAVALLLAWANGRRR